MFAFLKQSTASQSRLIGPFVDDTDFKTLETALTIANTDVKLSKNGAAGANKNSGGGTHRDNGMYSLTFDATDTDTVGELTGSISVSGALVVVFKFWVLEEAIYDAMFGASAAGFDANGRVDVGEWLGTAVTAGDIAIRTTLAKTTHITGFNDLATSDIDARLAAIGLDHLLSAAVTGTDVADNSIIAKLVSASATADWDDFVNTTESLQAIRDRGDTSWITGGGGSITQILNVQPLIPTSIDLANTATVRLGLMLINSLDDLPSTAEITPGTISIDRKAVGGTSWSAVVTDAACSESAGMVYYDEVFDSGSSYAAGDSIRITFKSQSITADANTHEVTDATGAIFYTEIRETITSLNNISTADVKTQADTALTDIGLDHLLAAAVVGADVVDNSIFAKLVSKSATADWDDFVNTTESLQALRDNLALEATVAALNDLSTADIDARLVAIGLDHLLSAAVTGTDVADNSIIAKLVSASATADWDDFVNTTESLQALRDNLALEASLFDFSSDAVIVGSVQTAAKDDIAERILTYDWNSIGETINDRSTLNALRFLRNKRDIAGGNLVVKQEDDVTTAWSASVTSDSAADPVIGIDPT